MPERFAPGWGCVLGCPSAKTVDEWHDDGRYYPKDYWRNSTYGIHSALTQSASGRPHTKVTALQSPSTTIFCQDSFEQLMEGPDDSLGLFPGNTQILTKWKPGSAYAAFYPGVDLTTGWWRHNRACQTLWTAGNVSRIRYSPQGIDYRCYTGERPGTLPQ